MSSKSLTSIWGGTGSHLWVSPQFLRFIMFNKFGASALGQITVPVLGVVFPCSRLLSHWYIHPVVYILSYVTRGEKDLACPLIPTSVNKGLREKTSPGAVHLRASLLSRALTNTKIIVCKQIILCDMHAPVVAVSPNKGVEGQQRWHCLFTLVWDVSNSFQLQSKSTFVLSNISNLRTHWQCQNSRRQALAFF